MFCNIVLLVQIPYLPKNLHLPDPCIKKICITVSYSWKWTEMQFIYNCPIVLGKCVMTLLLFCTSHARTFRKWRLFLQESNSQLFKIQYCLHTTVDNFGNIILYYALIKCNFYLLNKYISEFCDTLPMLIKQIPAKTTSFS